MPVITITKENFEEEVIKSDIPVLLDFWAGWCMPCRMVAPIIEELAEKYKESVTVAKVDVDKENALAARYNVMSIPTVLVFNDGIEVKRFVGVQTKEKYEKAIKT